MTDESGERTAEQILTCAYRPTHRIELKKLLLGRFEKHAVQQKCGELLFSTVADLMALVAIKAKPWVHAAYKHRTADQVGVAIASIYYKLQGLEPSVMVDVIPCEDGHSSECTMFPEILELVQPGQCWIGDRKYGTKTMMMSIALDKKSHFIFRHGLGNVPEWKTIDPKVKIGKHEGEQTPSSIAQRLITIGKDVNLKRMLKSKRGPKKPPPKRKSDNRGNHVATSRILAASREKS